MNDNIRVSVVTPSLNQGEFIEDTIRSVLNQTHPNIEHIVVDGGSTDSTPRILKKHEDRLQVISGQDEGQTDAINIGMRRSSGELVGWLNSDDVLLPDAVEIIAERYSANPKASIYYGAIQLIDETGAFLAIPKWRPLDYERLIRGRSALYQPGSFYPKCLVEQVGYLDASLMMGMDLDLFLKLLKRGDAEFIPKFVAKQRVHGARKTDQFRMRNLREALLIRKNHGVGLPALAECAFRISLHYVKLLLVRNRKEEN